MESLQQPLSVQPRKGTGQGFVTAAPKSGKHIRYPEFPTPSVSQTGYKGGNRNKDIWRAGDRKGQTEYLPTMNGQASMYSDQEYQQFGGELLETDCSLPPPTTTTTRMDVRLRDSDIKRYALSEVEMCL